MRYQELVDLGMERYEMNDIVFFEEYGYNSFLLKKELGDFYFEWGPENSSFVKLYKTEGHKLKGCVKIYELEVVEMLIKLHSSTQREDLGSIKYPQIFARAC